MTCGQDWASPMARGLARRPACWGVARPTPSTTRPQEPRPTAAGFPVGGVLGVRRALVLGGQGKWFGVVLEFRGFRFFRSALEFVFQRFGVWSVSQLFGKGCFLLAGSGLQVNHASGAVSGAASGGRSSASGLSVGCRAGASVDGVGLSVGRRARRARHQAPRPTAGACPADRKTVPTLQAMPSNSKRAKDPLIQ